MNDDHEVDRLLANARHKISQVLAADSKPGERNYEREIWLETHRVLTLTGDLLLAMS